ncbi:MAG: tetratricopeptide repeat protein [Cyclobacteriaceae bacterium]|nr:tetratricopeptide repeat protein [Cyclobacteriaceae bacterium]MDX5467363.1 tetratricopeptide repeat protein [Cyclobacteriaceae bacterium]
MLKRIFLFSLSCLFLNSSIAQDLAGRLEAALNQKDSARQIFEEKRVHLPTQRDSGLYFYFLGRYQRSQGERREAVKSNLKALELLQLEEDSYFYIRAYNNLTYLESILGDWEKAMLYGQKALESSRIVKDTNRMAYSLADISIVYHDMEQYDKGVEFSKNGLKILSEYSAPDPRIKAFVLNAVGINFDDWNQPDSALYYHYQVLELYPRMDSSEFTNSFNNIGNTLLKQGKFSEAEKWVEISLRYNLQAKDYYKIATNYNNLATIAYSLGYFYQAESLMDSTYKYVILSESREKLRDYLYDQFRFQQKKGDLAKAINYLAQYSELKDSIFKEDRVRMIGEIQTLYEVEAKERELAESRAALAEQELQSKSRNNLLLILLIGLILVLGSSFFIYYRQKNHNRHLEQEAKLQAVFAEQETQKRLQEQRSRISSDLHDNIGAQLTFIISSLDQLKFTDFSKEKVAEKLDQISSFTVDTINELRDTIWAMNKAQVTLEDLENRLSGLLRKARISCPEIHFDLQLDDAIPNEFALNSMEGINLYRIAQEALNNSIKHAEATQIEVQVMRKNEGIQLKIQDNGKGLPENRIGGNGLQTMKTRAFRIGKELIVNSEIGKGTQIIVS